MSGIGRCRIGWLALTAAAVVMAAGVMATACGGGTSSADKTKTASAAGGAATSVATSVATKVATTAPTAGTTGTAASGTATGATTVKTAAAGSLGTILTDANGMTLYTFKNDVANSGKSAAEALTAVWPPLTVTGAPVKPSGLSGDLAVITRGDGKTQVTYKGLPLYFFVNDKAPGDTKGQGVGGVWFVAQP